VAKRLTEKAIERLKVKPKNYTVWDAKQTGLGIIVRPTGKKSWRLQLTYPGGRGQSKRLLGRYPAMSLADARDKATEWYGLVRAGRDPRDVEQEQRQAAEAVRRAKALQNAATFCSVAERFLREHVAGQRRGPAVAREVRNYLVKAWGERPISDITPGDVKALVSTIRAGTHPQARKRKNGEKKGAIHQAENVLGNCSVLFRWAVHNDIISVSPTASLSKKWVLGPAHTQLGPRQRLLNDDELCAFWKATERLGYPFGPLYQLLLLTACRLNEIAKAQWRELHPAVRKAMRDAAKAGTPVAWPSLPPESKLLVIPATRFKSNAEHHVPLSDDALRIIEGLPHWSGCDYLFSITGASPVNLMSAGKNWLNMLMLRYLRALARLRSEDPATVKLEPFVIHDMRRVVRSHLSALEIPDHIAEMALGHGRKGIQRTYDLFKYMPQQREALCRWELRLQQIVSPTGALVPGNVLALRRGRT
jgi:integrase